jgi:hypothetical protein
MPFPPLIQSTHAHTCRQRFGEIPGVKIGDKWNSRHVFLLCLIASILTCLCGRSEQCSFAAVHRPLMAGIHGSKKAGAYSIVISCYYEDDKDEGDTM